MEENKRYYWLKLKEDFFLDKRMKRLKKISGGETYTIIYLKLLLLSLRDGGKLYFERIDESFPKELELIIDEKEDDIGFTLSYLLKVGLLKQQREDEYFLKELPNLVGSETKWAEKKRQYRNEKKRTMSLPCPTNVRQEIEKEKEKEIDIELEKEREGEKEKMPRPPSKSYGEFKNVKLNDEEHQKLLEIMPKHIEVMIEKLSRYIENSGKDYKSHYATILSWYEQDKDKLPKPKMTVEEYYKSDLSL